MSWGTALSRILALVVLLVVIVASGFWLARDRAASKANAPTTAGVASATAPSQAVDATEAAGRPATETGEQEPEAGQPAEGTPPSDADGAVQQGVPDGQPGEGGQAALVLPSGYTEVPYLTDDPVREFDAAQQVLDPALDYAAVLRTNRGDLTVDLYEGKTPNTVNNFVFLALNRFFDDVPFHRVLEGFMAQTGDPTGTGRGGPGYQFDDEIDTDLHFDSSGVLAMANAGKAEDGGGTNGSQFFITFEATPWLDSNHTIFGHLTAGDDVLDAITRVDPGTPSAIAMFDDTLGSLEDQGVKLPGEADETVSEAVEALLGTLPVAGQSFNVAGYVAAVGQAGGQPAFGFFPTPDQLETVVIVARPRQ